MTVYEFDKLILPGEDYILPTTTLHARPQEGLDGETNVKSEMDAGKVNIYGDGEIYN